MNDKSPVGEVRPSQLLWSYGPGALIDLPNISVITLGIEYWDTDHCPPVEESRLLATVKRVLGSQVDSLRMPPLQQGEEVNKWSAEANYGVPVRPFPRWLRCVKCGLLAEYDIDLFALKENRYRPEKTRFVHRGCKGRKGDLPAKDADAIPARFLIACKNGHLDDFPWRYYVHVGPSECKGILRFVESGASPHAENLWVKCDECGASRSLAAAFDQEGNKNLPGCRGRHAHLDLFEENCSEEPRAVLLGASNSWFPVTLSALAIPIGEDPILRLVRDGWEYFKDLGSEREVALIVSTLKRTSSLPGIARYDTSAIWKAIELQKSGTDTEPVSETDIRGPEWDVLTDPNPPTDSPHFLTSNVDTPLGFEAEIRSVVLVERLREVNALVGFTRLEAIDNAIGNDDGLGMAALSGLTPQWVPACQVHGEGIFIRFKEDRLLEWEERDAVKSLGKKLFKGHRGWRNARRLDPEEGFPGVRYAMLHTLAHLLIRELALECGYNAASIRERIYADTENVDPQAGILVYTAAADSDGTLGGLVELGKPENLRRLLIQALDRAKICSSDPLCSEHDPGKDKSLHIAACHACSFVAETSCERCNRYLDRALLIPTLDTPDAAFFGDRWHKII